MCLMPLSGIRKNSFRNIGSYILWYIYFTRILEKERKRKHRRGARRVGGGRREHDVGKRADQREASDLGEGEPGSKWEISAMGGIPKTPPREELALDKSHTMKAQLICPVSVSSLLQAQREGHQQCQPGVIWDIHSRSGRLSTRLPSAPNIFPVRGP